MISIIVVVGKDIHILIMTWNTVQNVPPGDTVVLGRSVVTLPKASTDIDYLKEKIIDEDTAIIVFYIFTMHVYFF